MSVSYLPEAIGLDPSRLQRVYRFLADAAASGAVPAAAILIARHGVPMPPQAFGRQLLTADSPPARPDTIFLVASVTKPVVVAAVALLIERGLLTADDPAAAYVPEFGHRGKEQITLRHLMTHTSGLPDMLPENEALRTRHAPLSEFVARICELELDYTPGTAIRYQSCGIAILGEIVARVAGMPLREFLRQEFFVPLGMVDTALGAEGLPAERIAHVNVGEEMAARDWNWNRPYWWHFGAPWGGMFTTVTDMFRFCQLFLNGGRLGTAHLLSPATVEAMTRDQTGALPGVPAAAHYGHSWGWGWRLFPAAQWGFYGNLAAPGTYGHGGATGTVVWNDPARQMVAVIFTTEPSTGSSGFLARCSNLVAACAL